MTILRVPESTEDAVRQAVGLLGEAAVCAATHYSGAAVRAWSNADDRRGMPFEAAVALDRALKAQGYPPIFANHLTRLAHAAPVQPSLDPESAEREAYAGVLKAIDESGGAMAVLCQAAADGALSRHELTGILAMTERWKRHIDQVRRKAFQALRSGVGRPSAAKKGHGR